MRDLRGNDARFSASRASKHEKRRGVVAHGFALGSIEGKLQGAFEGVATIRRAFYRRIVELRSLDAERKSRFA